MADTFWESSLRGTSMVVILVVILFIGMTSFMGVANTNSDFSSLDISSGDSMLAMANSGVEMQVNFAYYSIYIIMLISGIVVVKTKF